MAHSPQQLVAVWHQHLHADAEGPTFISATAWSLSIVLSSTSERSQLPSGHTNALAENLWSTIKTELIYWPGNTFVTRAEADAAIFRYIDGWYNPRRIQQGLGGLSPDEYEEAWHHQHEPATIHPEPDESR
jgi:Integrase core domain